MPGYDGQFCDKEIDLCKLSPCLNGGSCTFAKGKFNCDCPVDFIGSRCQALVRFHAHFLIRSEKITRKNSASELIINNLTNDNDH